MDLVIRLDRSPVRAAGEVEVVERKGLGHPDTICDAVAEEISARLSCHYLERFGHILHHNVDKVLLVGGSARPRLGGGEVTAAIEVYLAGRATDEWDGESIPIHDLATAACREWLRAHLHCLNVERDLRIVSRIKPGSASLASLFARGQTAPLANDTSCGVGYAPLTELERIVLNVERCLTDADAALFQPAIGPDVKVMGVRIGGRIDLTIACAVIDRYVPTLEAYQAVKAAIADLALTEARRHTALDVVALVNAADDVERGELFLTVTGTSAESGDDGEVGRGNRGSGLITPYRQMTLEAMAGKNPVTHVGKSYSALAHRACMRIAGEIPGVAGAECVLVSDIGRRVDDPRIADVRVAIEGDVNEDAVRSEVAQILAGVLASLETVRDDFVARRIPVF